MSIKNTIKDSVVPEATANDIGNAIGIVLSSNERDNQCTVAYRSTSGTFQRRNNVEVQVSNADNWFPKAGEPVHLMIDDDTVMIVSRVITDYRAQRDKFSASKNNVDAQGGVVGNTIA
jgi:hypothetical protein